MHRPWEYHAATVGFGEDLDATLRLAGEAGWEAWHLLVTDVDEDTGALAYLVHLKRPKVDASPCPMTMLPALGAAEISCQLRGPHDEHEGTEVVAGDVRTVKWKTDAEGRPVRQATPMRDPAKAAARRRP